jgi:hypothetical protein
VPVDINSEENSNETAKLLKGQRNSSWIHIPLVSIYGSKDLNTEPVHFSEIKDYYSEINSREYSQ